MPTLIENIGEEINIDIRTWTGSLLISYLANCTRPDIQTAVSILSSHNMEARNCVLTGCKRVAPNKLNLEIHVDSDYASNKEKRRSRSGVVLLINGTPICWGSQLQKTVALSSCEAEYIAMAKI
eukprot:Pgem_evm2s4396